MNAIKLVSRAWIPGGLGMMLIYAKNKESQLLLLCDAVSWITAACVALVFVVLKKLPKYFIIEVCSYDDLISY